MVKVIYFLYKIKIWILSHSFLLYPTRGKYADLYCYKNVFGTKKYVQMRNKIFSKSEVNIRKKNHKSVRIVMEDCSEWCTTDIYNYFDRKGVDIAVVLVPFFHGTEESIRKAYRLCREFCETKKFRYIEAYNPSDWKLVKESAQSVYGDVMIYTNPWMGSYPEEIKVNNIPLSIITCYIPYGFMLMKAEQHQFNQISHNMFTHIYCESAMHYQMFEEYCDIGKSHVEFSGHPKMDCYIERHKTYEERSYDAINTNQQNVRPIKIIYSPHWNFTGGYATFIHNGLQILQYAETHTDTTLWVYKPHPLLEKELITQGLMSAEEYGAYVERWERLPNAKVYLSGDYQEIFMSSDCMINDSISFIAEYMYAHKPMLLLHNDETNYNSFGMECINHVYKCNGNDLNSIFQFIENIRYGKDYMKETRERFFSMHLDYYHTKGLLASEYIISRISGILGTC